ncbi:CehA/McbA family metallohydrolase [Flavobacterium wongokense]|uniref:CehA/McbA family metallohydrolase n=1 Tax=Flavobacterium wongokense TaxID=2910674 RepID=UPI001F2B1E8B|nr:CehA/McbA family metallohydrolase [Flavobacterium sp. WG47]MCF6133203.1 CehA/McbA family metallohydrolase [Flavobacterium sp. WG47]
MTRFLFLILLSLSFLNGNAQDQQPFYFHVNNLIEALEFTGTPLEAGDKKAIKTAVESDAGVETIQKIIDGYVLFNIEINAESRVKVGQGNAKAVLFQNGWKTFLIKIQNKAGITAGLNIQSEQAKRTYDGGERIYGMAGAGKGTVVTRQNINDRWLDLGLYTNEPMKPSLSGLETEYFIVQLYSRDSGKRAAKFEFDCGKSTQDIGFRNEVNILFTCIPSQKIKLTVKDEKQLPTTASFIIKDKQGHIYPSQAKRLAPDFFFQPQVYRADNEFIELPVGEYSITYGKGPEYHSRTKILNVENKASQTFSANLERWIDPTLYGWFSGDHHIHAAGCSHYTSPTQGVDPQDMMRHILGEGVNVGCVLTWGPGYDHQKQFFEGKDNKLSTKDNLLRYDLEISGFPSSHAGHLVLLRLKDQYYPNANSLNEWPTYTLPILRWAKAQNAITGYAHSGLGLDVRNDSLPNYEMPRFDGIGANEYIVAVTQNLVDFISTMDTPPSWELNIWYHTLNCGFRTRISGETDFPCMSDDKVAHGRSYVKLDNTLTFDSWIEGLKQGRTYTSEGKSHIFDFKVNQSEMGKDNSELNLSKPSKVTVTAKVAAYLNEEIDPNIKKLDLEGNVWAQKPFWNIERARLGTSRNVFVELIVNGIAVAKKEITADGKLTDLKFETNIDKSSWVALRILPSSHSNPIFVLVDKKPIRAEKKSAEWCLKAVDACWEQKKAKIAPNEIEAAKKDYENAKDIYRQLINESGK